MPLLLKHEIAQAFVSELLGTWILVTLTDLGAGLATVMQRQSAPNFVPAVALSNGLAVTVAVSVTARVSGGHLNPAVSLAMFTLRQLSALKLLVYHLAQLLGGYLGGLTVYMLYHEMFNDIDGGVRQVSGENATVGMLVTLPNAGISNGIAFADQVVNTCLLLLAIRAITDARNLAAPAVMQPLLIGLTVTCIIASEVVLTASCLNPARDFGPRLAALTVGYGTEVFTHRNYYFFIPLFGPYIGGLLGAWLYELSVANPLQHRAEMQGKEEEDKGDNSVVNVAFRRNNSIEAS